MLTQEEFDALPVIDEYTPMPSGGASIPTMEIKNSGGSFADSMAPYLVRQESSGNPYAVSNAGAQGLWQIMPNTGREMASKLGMQNFDPFNPQHSEMVGKAYLNQMYDTFQDPQLALAAYNAGPGRVQQAIQRAGTNDPSAVLQFLPSETQNYVPKILGNAQKESAYAAPNTEVNRPKQLTQEEFDALPIIGEEPKTEQPAPQDLSWADYLKGLGREGLQGATFNWGDEMGLVDLEKQKAFEAQYPKASIAANIAGGLAPNAIAYLATALTGGAAAPAAAATTANTAANAGRLANLLKTSGRVLTGLGPETAAKTGLGRIAQGVGYGAAYGGLASAGNAEGGAGEKTAAGLAGALLGGGLGATGGALVEKFSNKAPKGKVAKEVSRIVNDVTDDELRAAQTELADAASKNVPLFLPDAIDQADVNATVKALMRSKEARNAARDAIDSRAEGQLDRVTSLIDVLSPKRDSYEVGGLIQKRASDVIDAETKARNDLAEELFGNAYKKAPVNDIVQDPKFNEVMNSEIVQPIIKRIRKFPKYKDLRDDDPRMVQKVLEEITAEMQSPNAGSLANDYGDLKTTIYNTLDIANPELIKARDTFRIDSEKIKALKDVGLGNFANKDQFKVTDFGRQLLDPKTPLEKLNKISDALGEDGPDLIKAAIRAELQDRIEKGVTDRDITSKFNTPAIRKRLSALMGESESETLLKNLDQEVLMAKQNRALTPRSDTADNIKDSRAGIVSALISLLTAPKTTVLNAVDKGLRGREYSVGADTVKLITDPKSSADLLSELLVGRQATNQAIDKYRQYGNATNRSSDSLAKALMIYLDQEGN